MMKNITYLFGAGASSNCLPTYKNFKNRFGFFVEFIDRHKIQNTVKKFKSEIDIFHQLLCSIQSNLEFHNTPDTFAKKLFHLGDIDTLNNLKISLIAFFTYEQIFLPEEIEKNEKTSIDLRYDSLIAAILKPIPAEVEFIDNINILTWNYDLQFEIAYSKYVNSSISQIQKSINCFPELLQKNQLNENLLSITHLNGVAYAPPNRVSTDLIGHFISKESVVVEYILSLFKHFIEDKNNYKSTFLSLLSFAWENTEQNFFLKDTDAFKNAKSVAVKTNILIINGYSFPIFNRIVDLELLKQMNFLKKIYIQSPSANDVMKILEEIAGIEGVKFKKDIIIDLGYYNQFYIPDYLNIQNQKQLLI